MVPQPGQRKCNNEERNANEQGSYKDNEPDCALQDSSYQRNVPKYGRNRWKEHTNSKDHQEVTGYSDDSRAQFWLLDSPVNHLVLCLNLLLDQVYFLDWFEKLGDTIWNAATCWKLVFLYISVSFKFSDRKLLEWVWNRLCHQRNWADRAVGVFQSQRTVIWYWTGLSRWEVNVPVLYYWSAWSVCTGQNLIRVIHLRNDRICFET